MPLQSLASERVYWQLKRDIMSDRFDPGAVLGVQALADELGMSISPIRDAMQRLVGEQLLRSHRGGGFELPGCTAPRLRDMYSWHAQIVCLAISHWMRPAQLSMPEPSDLHGPMAVANRTRAIFEAIADASANPEHRVATAAMNDRLSAVRHHEQAIRGRARELSRLEDLVRLGSARKVRAAIMTYHRRRLNRIAQIVQSIRAEERK